MLIIGCVYDFWNICPAGMKWGEELSDGRLVETWEKKNKGMKRKQLEHKELMEHNEEKIQTQGGTHDSETIYKTETATSL